MPIAIFIIAIGILLRLIPHAPNFAPVGAIAIFAGIYLGKKWSWAIPIAMMFVSDLFIGVYDWKIMVTVYACFVLSVLIGHLLSSISYKLKAKSFNISSILPTIVLYSGGSLLGSIVFFLVTNAAVVFFGNWYPHSFAGLMQSYIAGLPFFRNTVASDLFYLAIFASSYELARFLVTRLSHRKITVR